MPACALSCQAAHWLPWELERDGEVVRINPSGPLLVGAGGASDLAVEAALAGTGIVHLFETWLRPYLDCGILVPVLKPWWQNFFGPFLYYPGRRLVPAPLRAFVDFIKVSNEHNRSHASQSTASVSGGAPRSPRARR